MTLHDSHMAICHMTTTTLLHDYHKTHLPGECQEVFVQVSWHTPYLGQFEEWHSTSEQTRIQKTNLGKGRENVRVDVQEQNCASSNVVWCWYQATSAVHVICASYAHPVKGCAVKP